MVSFFTAALLMVLAMLPAGLFSTVREVREVPRSHLANVRGGSAPWACAEYDHTGYYHGVPLSIWVGTPDAYCPDRPDWLAFMLAHEVGHNICITRARDTTEACADAFAAYQGHPRPVDVPPHPFK